MSTRGIVSEEAQLSVSRASTVLLWPGRVILDQQHVPADALGNRLAVVGQHVRQEHVVKRQQARLDRRDLALDPIA